MMTWLSSSENIYHRKKTKSMEKLNYICRHSSHSLKGSGFSGDGKITREEHYGVHNTGRYRQCYRQY